MSSVVQFRGTVDSPATAQVQAAIATPPEELLAKAREQGRAADAKYAGGVNPPEAWALFQAGAVVFVDVRTTEERKFVGHIPGTHHIAWTTGTAMTRNPRFLRELEAKVEKNKDTVILLLCRSGKRSAAAAEAATKGGFTNVFNVLEGFEGDIDELQQRGKSNGWRHWDLPWIQD